MAEPKAKTLQQKLGFFDEDLKKPLHDDILKWVDSNAENIIYQLYPSLKEFNQEKADELKKYCENCIAITKKHYSDKITEIEKSILSSEQQIKYYQEKLNKEDNYYKESLSNELEKKEKQIIELKSLKDFSKNIDDKLKLNDLPSRKPIVVLEKTWEYPVTSQSKSITGYVSSKNIVGFIDLKITFVYNQLTVSGIDIASKLVKDEINWEQTKKKISYKYGDYEGENTHSIYFEIKTKIPSLGELFRQLRMYQEFIKGDFAIVCPDDDEKTIIEEQGYKFLTYK